MQLKSTELLNFAPSVPLSSASSVFGARPARCRLSRARFGVPGNRAANICATASFNSLAVDVNTDVAKDLSRPALAEIGLVGLAVMGQNLALNIAEHGFDIAVYNRSHSKTVDTVERAKVESLDNKLVGYENIESFVKALKKPRKIILLVKAGQAVDATIETLKNLLEEGDMIIDGGNEFYSNTERRADMLEKEGIQYMGMGVSGGEEGARNGPSLMPGGPRDGYDKLEPILKSIAANVDGKPCVTYIGPRGAGNFVKMIHNGIEYGDMQLIGEVYDMMRTVAGVPHSEIADIFDDWNRAELQSYLVEITARLLRLHDDLGPDPAAFLIDKVLDKTGTKGTGTWTVQEAASRYVPAPTIAAALDARYMSALKDDRVASSNVLNGPNPDAHRSVMSAQEKQEFIADLRTALYASKICSYAQGMNIIREAGRAGNWDSDLGAIAQTWKGGCIIRAAFLDRINAAYSRDPNLPSLLVDSEFADELAAAQSGWRRVVCQAINTGVAVPALSGSLAYYDAYRRSSMPSAQLVQSQRDFFGSHTYMRNDMPGVFHTRWSTDGVSVKVE